MKPLYSKLSEKPTNISKVKHPVKVILSNCTKLINDLAFSKTFINTANSEMKPFGEGQQPNSMSVEAFKLAVEKDAAERAERRARQRSRAEKLKERANTFFKAGNWRRAADLYSKAIEVCKDWEILYTNRAQAYLRSGDANAALADCDTALKLLEFRQSATTNSAEFGASIVPNPQVAKTHFHRGKALMALGKPEEALLAYEQSRAFSLSSKPISGGSVNSPWPAYLVEYVAQAEAAVAAKQADARAEAEFEARAIRPESTGDGSQMSSVPSSQQLVCLLAQLARANQDQAYYSAGLRQLIRLFDSVPREQPTVQIPNVEVPPTEERNKPESNPSRSNRRGRKKKQSGSAHQTALQTNKNVPSKKSDPVPVETFTDLQTLFRLKNGFTLLGREVNEICKDLDQLSSTGDSAKTTSEPVLQPVNKTDSKQGDLTDRLLALLNLTSLLTRDCGENQRILVVQLPGLIQMALKCTILSTDFVAQVVNQLSDNSLSEKISGSRSSFEARTRHKLEALRSAASDLLVTLTSQPSGRQALLSAVGSSSLLDAIAVCLAESLGQTLLTPLSNGTTGRPVGADMKARLSVSEVNRRASLNSNSSSAISAICAARAARLLENLTESPGFLLSARSSVSNLESLLSLIEAAVSVTNRNNRSITTTARCLASLLDGLSAACHDTSLRTNILQRRQPLLTALAECLTQHAPLLTDPEHALLVGSTCRLLHNICVGSLGPGSTASPNSLSTVLNASGRLADTLLAGVGVVLDQPGHGPELRAVATALAGRLLPLCSAERILSWLNEPDDSPIQANGQHPNNLPSDRSRLLLAILDSCSIPNSGHKSHHTNGGQSKEDPTLSSTSDSNRDQDHQLSAHMLSGCIRCLAAATNHSVRMRYFIGDDRRRVRRLARVIRAKLPPSSGGVPPQNSLKSSVCSGPTQPRDEPLAGNACLILQHCCDDTPLAEHLQGTSVILDLLQLIQESQQLDTKRNAAILIGKLAQASHAHRDELTRLDGWSVLTPFNSWNAALDRM
ncbi:tetratricopeptide repeat protein 12 [Clonorchis sinensis]|uniref:Tetratricopeptide repeat protein 12 n=1 Tax=Clonorchis sinensis TaxID=79923 RepID=G7YC33_CLOSI|nr:tetratricopeptide repeat protein 12 [Clonorchis sinensis]